MLAISPQFCPYPIISHDYGHEQEKMMSYLETSAASTILYSPSSKIPLENGCSFNHGDGDGVKVKKLNHNASERDRRKKMNSLYAKLRSLLPPQDHSKKLSIPATISRMLKYIPELRNEVERLMQKRERFAPQNSSLEFTRKPTRPSSNSAASATRINDAEIVIQISMPKTEKSWLSEAISRVEEEGFLMVNASSFESFQGRLFYNMHFQAQVGQVIDAQKLKDKVWP